MPSWLATTAPGTLTPEWVPGVYDRRLVDYKNLSKQCPIGPRDLVVVATAGHKSDIDVVIQAMRAKPAYLGCLGSRRKTAFVRARLEQEGFTQEQIGELHLPIGVAIEAEDPEEIAISNRRRDDPPAPHQTRPPQALIASPYMSCGEIRTV